MKRSLVILLAALALLAGLSGCDIITGAQSSPSPTDLASLGLSRAQIEQWQDQGIVNVTDAAEASILAGFDVQTPDYVPPGLISVSKYMVSTNGPTLKRTGSDAPVTIHVQLVWGPSDETRAISMILDESNRPFSHGDVTETTLPCGATVMKGSDPNSSGALAGAIIYHWEQDGVTLDLTGVPGATVSEADLDKVVCSIVSSK